MEDLLANRVPGLQIARRGDGTFSMRIRGQAGLRGGSGDAEPLLIVDGVTIGHGTQASALASLAPRDIARIEVLKDIAATGPFGARGANGVLIVYTKRSKPR